MDQETAFLTILQAAESYAVVDGDLRITAGEQRLVFIPTAKAQATHLIVITMPEANIEFDANTAFADLWCWAWSVRGKRHRAGA